MELEEAVVLRQAAVRTLGQQARVWSVRILLNLLVIALLGAAFYGVYWATGAAVGLQVRRSCNLHFRGWMGLKSVIPGILGRRDGGVRLDLGLRGAEGRRGWGRMFSKVVEDQNPRVSLLGPPSLLGGDPCPTDATAKARSGLPSVHLHLWGQLLAATRVQAHCPTGGLHQEPPDCSYPAQVLAFGRVLGMMAGLV